jgi:hypothetical protein
MESNPMYIPGMFYIAACDEATEDRNLWDDVCYSSTFEGPPEYGNVHGTVSAESGALLGVSIDLTDSEGWLYSTTITDESGYYEFIGVPNGSYSATVATPLGYSAEQEVETVNICGADYEIDFSLVQLELPLEQRGRGYWTHQVNALISGKGNPHETYEDMCDYMNLIQSHFNQNGLNPVNVFEVPLTDDCDQRLEALRATISPKPKATMNEKARGHLTALLLNMVSGKIAQWHEISEDGLNVSQAITYCNDLIADGQPDNDEMAKDIAEMINEGKTVPAGWIDPETANIAYRGTLDDGLPTQYTLEQNYPNPFNPATEIAFALPSPSDVKLEVLNILGQVVSTVYNGHLPAGYYSYPWDGSNMASGIYLYRLTADEFVDTKKMILLK